MENQRELNINKHQNRVTEALQKPARNIWKEKKEWMEDEISIPMHT